MQNCLGINLEVFVVIHYHYRGESTALGTLWANCLFSKSMKGKILNFLHEVGKMISVISVQV